jgi:hypothetical protein
MSQKKALSDEVQEHLRRIAELTHCTADAVRNEINNLVRELDAEVEIEIESSFWWFLASSAGPPLQQRSPYGLSLGTA